MSWKPSPMLRYTAMRLGIFVAAFAVVWGLVYFGAVPAGLGESNGLWMLLLAMVISAPLSFVVLRKQREAAAIQIEERVERSKRVLADNRSQEDLADDAARAAAQG